MTEKSPVQAAPDELLVGRRPILGASGEVAAYALSFHRRDLGTDAGTGAASVAAAYAAHGFAEALASYPAYLRADETFLADTAIDLLPADRIVLELDFATPPTDALVDRCAALRDSGFRLALSDRDGSPPPAALLPLLDIVEVDVAAADRQAVPLAERVAALTALAAPSGRPPTLLAAGVDTPEAMERCRQLGFALFAGEHFTRPQIVAGRHLSSSQLSLIRMINLVAREADTADIEAQIKREPALAVNLLRLVNAVGFGAAQHVDSLPRALAILGRRQLLRWLQLLLMASSAGDGAPERNPLLQFAAQRGRLLETLARRSRQGGPAATDEAFLVGIMSLMPTALGLPIGEILDQIPVAPSLRQALAAREGKLGQLLALAERLDEGDWPGCDALLSELDDLSPAAVSAGLAEALAWLHGDGSDA